MDVDKFDCSRTGKQSAVLTVVDIFRVASNFSENEHY